MNQYSYLKWIDWLNCWDFVCEWARTAVEWLLRKHPALFIPFIVVSLGSNMLSLKMSQLLTTVWNSCCDCLQEQFRVTHENQSHCCVIRGFQLKIVLPSLISLESPDLTPSDFWLLPVITSTIKRMEICYQRGKNCIQVNRVKNVQPSSQKIHVWKFILRA